jgi:hypothetical protein
MLKEMKGRGSLVRRISVAAALAVALASGDARAFGSAPPLGPSPREDRASATEGAPAATGGHGSSNYAPAAEIASLGPSYADSAFATSGETGPNPASNTSAPGEVKLYAPKDRCQAGVIVFGELKCRAMNKGGWGRPSSELTAQGRNSSGQSCSYKPASSGLGSSLPANRSYNLSAVTSSSGESSDNYGAGAYGSQPPVWLNAGTLQVHSLQTLENLERAAGSVPLASLEQVSSAGCIILTPACQKAFLDYVSSGVKVKLDVVEVPSVDYSAY